MSVAACFAPPEFINRLPSLDTSWRGAECYARQLDFGVIVQCNYADVQRISLARHDTDFNEIT